MRKLSKFLALVIGLAVCFTSFCTPALAVSKTPEEEASYLQNIIPELNQFVYIDETNMFTLSSLPAGYSHLYSEMKKSIDSTNALIQQIMPLGKFTFDKYDKSFSSEALIDLNGNGIDRLYWWGNRKTSSSEDCEKILKDFEEFKALTPVSKYHQEFMDKLKVIQSINKSRVEYDICTFNFSSYNVSWCFAANTLKVSK